jgi:hypothetical protein
VCTHRRRGGERERGEKRQMAYMTMKVWKSIICRICPGEEMMLQLKYKSCLLAEFSLAQGRSVYSVKVFNWLDEWMQPTHIMEINVHNVH